MSDHWRVRINKQAKKDLKKMSKDNKGLYDNFLNIIDTLKSNPFEQSQSFEKLTPPIHSIYSRRINVKHRVVYSVDRENSVVTIYSCWGHYE